MIIFNFISLQLEKINLISLEQIKVKFVMCILISRVQIMFYLLKKYKRSLETRLHITNLTRSLLRMFLCKSNYGQNSFLWSDLLWAAEKSMERCCKIVACQHFLSQFYIAILILLSWDINKNCLKHPTIHKDIMLPYHLHPIIVA